MTEKITLDTVWGGLYGRMTTTMKIHLAFEGVRNGIDQRRGKGPASGKGDNG